MANVEWNNLAGQKVIDLRGSFMTECGDLIYWSSTDSYKAQEHLQKISKKPIEIKMRKPLSESALAALNACTIDGLVVKLGPDQLDRNVYTEVRDALQGIGGAWKGGKVFGFVFPHDPSDLLTDLQGGTKRNLKKEFQFFGTPKRLAKRLVDMAEITNGDLLVCEPEAGQGAIVIELLAHEPDLCVHGYELMPQNRDILAKIPNFILLGDDFLDNNTKHLRFDRFVANPPFNNNRDIDHINEMYRRLRSNGVMVSMASKHWRNSSNKKETEFRNWLKFVNAEIEEVEAGEFKESGTNISTCIVKIKK